MTELAYLADPEAAYTRRFRARIVARPPGAVVLDRTFFYPAGGGQPADAGILQTPEGAAVEVIDVSRRGDSVLHRARGTANALASLAVGGEIDGILDWPRRYRHMRLHTAQHFLSAAVFARTGLRTRKAVLKGVGASIELEGPLSAEELPRLDADARDVVARPRPVAIHQFPRAEWNARPSPRSGLVALPPQVDPVRVIEIEGLDACPCGGTHLRSTAEIGALAIAPPAPPGGRGVLLTFTLAGSTADPPTPSA